MIPLVIKAETASTNDDAWSFYREGCRAPMAVLACRQTRGRGRRGRTWHSGGSGNLHLSLLLFVRREAGGLLPFLPLGAMLRVLAVLRRHSAVNLGLKWPNDLLAGPGKCGGILVESRTVTGEDFLPVVMGIGVNLNSIPAECRGGEGSTAVALGPLCGRRLPLIDIAREIIYDVQKWIGSLPPGRAAGGAPGSVPRVIDPVASG